MVDVLRVYNNGTKIAEGTTPINLLGLTPLTKYNLKCAWYNGVKESAKVDVPEFTTTAQPETPVLPTAMNTNVPNRTLKVGETKGVTISFVPENTTNKGITWAVDETALEYVPVLNDNQLRFKGLKTGTYNVVITSVANTNLTKTIPFTVTN